MEIGAFVFVLFLNIFISRFVKFIFVKLVNVHSAVGLINNYLMPHLDVFLLLPIIIFKPSTAKSDIIDVCGLKM